MSPNPASSNAVPTTIDSDWSRWPNFSPVELRCHGSGKLCLHPGFMDALQHLREMFARPMTVTSGCRAAWYNEQAGGHPKSLHIADAPRHANQLGTLAVDIATPDGSARGDLFILAWSHNWSIGWGRGFLHLDRRDLIDLPPATFDYY